MTKFIFLCNFHAIFKMCFINFSMLRYLLFFSFCFSSCALWWNKSIKIDRTNNKTIKSQENFEKLFYQNKNKEPLVCTHKIEGIDTNFARKSYLMNLQHLVDSLMLPPSIYGDTTNWIGVPNFGIRNPNFVIIHHTAQSDALSTIKFFINKLMPVSAHYLIGKDGTIYPLLHDQLRAWHAGVSKWGTITDINSISIGIELDNNGKEPFPSIQIDSLISLLNVLKVRYKIPTVNFWGHADVAPERKRDPNPLFPWKYLASKGFGIWYDEEIKKIKIPANFDGWLALRLLGYDMAKPDMALIAFRRHFRGTEEDMSKSFSNLELKILFSLVKKIFISYD